MKNIDLVANPWPDYALLDSGLNRRLERYGDVVLIRPETQALWTPAHPEKWKTARAEFRFGEGKGSWQKRNVPESWDLSFEDLRFTVRLTSFKHTGVFPEQAPNWQWIKERVGALRKSKEEVNVLNLFGYTGLASVAAAKAGAHVTHVDASRQSNEWAKDNARLSGAENIRYILDDAFKFVEREVRRGVSYDGIILDPPAFGRGPKGEVWHIEEKLPSLLGALKKIFAATPGSFFLLNGYAAGYAPLSLLQATQSVFPKAAEAEFGELHIKESGTARTVPSGIYVRFTA